MKNTFSCIECDIPAELVSPLKPGIVPTFRVNHKIEIVIICGKDMFLQFVRASHGGYWMGRNETIPNIFLHAPGSPGVGEVRNVLGNGQVGITNNTESGKCGSTKKFTVIKP